MVRHINRILIRTFILKKYRLDIFKQIHNTALPSITKQIVSKFVWPKIKSDVTRWTKSCIEYQKNKITRHDKSEYGKYEEPDSKFQIIHLDII